MPIALISKVSKSMRISPPPPLHLTYASKAILQISGADIRYLDSNPPAMSAERPYMMNLMGSQAAGYGFFRIVSSKCTSCYLKSYRRKL